MTQLITVRDGLGLLHWLDPTDPRTEYYSPHGKIVAAYGEDVRTGEWSGGVVQSTPTRSAQEDAA